MIKNICNKLYSINVFYVKAIQWNLQNNFNIDNDLIEYFRKFSTNVPYTYKEINFGIIDQLKEYAKQNNYELTLETEPINSGTIALVYKGTLNGDPIALKLLRNNIKQHIESGLDGIVMYLKLLFKIINLFYSYKTTVITLIADNKEQLLKQCDMNNEVENIDLFQQLFINSKDIKIPKVYKEFTNVFPCLIIMEFIKGENINTIDIKNLSNYYDAVQDFIIHTMFIHKKVHGDFHMGNLIFMDNGNIGIIDYGLILSLNSKQSDSIFNMFLAITNKNCKLLINSLTNLVIKEDSDKDYIRSRLEAHKEAIIKNLLNNNDKINIGYILELLKELLGKNSGKNKINSTCSNIMLSFVSSLYIVQQTNPNNIITVGFKEYIDRKKLLD
jgi:ubiquinone biosynthesis protein